MSRAYHVVWSIAQRHAATFRRDEQHRMSLWHSAESADSIRDQLTAAGVLHIHLNSRATTILDPMIEGDAA